MQHLESMMISQVMKNLRLTFSFWIPSGKHQTWMAYAAYDMKTLASNSTKLMILKSQYKRISDHERHSKIETRRKNLRRNRHFKTFHRPKTSQKNQSQDIGLLALSKIFNQWCWWHQIDLITIFYNEKCRQKLQLKCITLFEI